MTTPRTYVTLLSSDDYLDGVLVLHESLKRTAAKYGLLVLIAGNVSGRSEAVLRCFGIYVKRVSEAISIPEDILQANIEREHAHWNNVFDKLFIFDLIEFEKIVYLDSDMLVLRNIDSLFEKPHMSAVIAGRSFPGNEHWKALNAGLMVVEPQAGLSAKILAVLPLARKGTELVSDQSLLHHYDEDWPSKDWLHLDERYNVFATMLDHYVDRLGYALTGPDGIAVVHFVGAKKPWQATWAQNLATLEGLRYHRKFGELRMNLRYLLALLKVRCKKWFARPG